jgi:uncharacterized delta-60 repeat protein
VGGSFTTLGGQTRNYLGRLNADGTVDSGFNPGADNSVLSLAVQADGKILVGGGFTTLGRQTRNYIGRLNNTEPATENLSWSGSSVTWLRGGASPEVWRTTFEVSTNGGVTWDLWPGTRIVGGWQISGISAPANASIRARGYVAGGDNASGWFVETVMEPPYFTAQPQSQSVWLGDNALFSVVASGSSPLAYQWQHNGTNLPSATNATLALASVTTNHAGNYSVIVSNAYGSVTSAAAMLTVTTPVPVPDSFNPGASGTVLSLAVQADGKIVVGGGFTTLGGQTRERIARLNADGTLDSGFNPGADNLVFSLAVEADGKILVGGCFSTLGGQTRNYLGRLNADGTGDSGFNPGARSEVYSLAVQADGKIVVGGNFTTLGGQTREYLVRLNADGTIDSGFNPGANSDVNSVAVQADGKILVGGLFTTLGGQMHNRLGRLNADGTVDSGFNSGADGGVLYLAVQADGKILVGGGFTTLGGQTREYLGRLNADGTIDSGFNPWASDWVYSLAVQADGKILVGGGFSTLGGQTRNRLGRLNADGTIDGGFNPEANGGVYSLAVQADGKILVGGDFTTLGGQTRNYLGRLNNTEPATDSLSWTGSSLTWLRGGASPEVWRTTFEVSTNGGVTWDLWPGTRVLGGWQIGEMSAPDNASIRARGYVAGGYRDASGWFVETGMGPPYFTAQPQSQSVWLGGDATFSASVAGTPPIAVEWRCNGTNVPGATNLTLTLTNVQMVWANASFQLVASNSLGAAASSNAVLTVRLPTPPTVVPGSLVWSNEQFGVTWQGDIGLVVEIQASTNLVDWSPLLSLTNLLGTVPFTDNATNFPHRFYRLRQWP